MRSWLPRWKPGWGEVGPLLVWATPMFLWAVLAGTRTSTEVILVAVAVGVGLGLKHLLPANLEDLALLPPIVALLVELSTVPLTVDSVLLAAVAGVGLLLWAGAAPASGVTLVQQFEPAMVPALAVGVAVVVLFFLPGGSGGQVGLAALLLVAALGLSAWLYLRSASEVAAPQPSP
ncbi:MAG: hypothetical protein WA688_09985 [Thermoplasmata archaeon]